MSAPSATTAHPPIASSTESPTMKSYQKRPNAEIQVIRQLQQQTRRFRQSSPSGIAPAQPPLRRRTRAGPATSHHPIPNPPQSPRHPKTCRRSPAQDRQKTSSHFPELGSAAG